MVGNSGVGNFGDDLWVSGGDLSCGGKSDIFFCEKLKCAKWRRIEGGERSSVKCNWVNMCPREGLLLIERQMRRIRDNQERVRIFFPFFFFSLIRCFFQVQSCCLT